MNPLRPLAFGEILDGAFTLYRHSFATLFTTALAAAIPLALVSRIMEAAAYAPQGTTDFSAVIGVLIAVPLSALLWAALWGALTRQTARLVLGEEATLRDGYAASLRALPRFVASGFFVFLLMLAGGVVVLFVAGILVLPVGLAGAPPWAPIAFATALTFLTVAVMAAVMTSFFAIAAAIVVEKLGPWAAIRRSHRLAGGARWRIVGVIVVSSIIVLLPTLGLAFAVGLGTAMWDVQAAATLSPAQVILQQLVTIVTTALTTPFMVGCITLLYFDRRVRTEGYDLELEADALSEHALG